MCHINILSKLDLFRRSAVQFGLKKNTLKIPVYQYLPVFWWRYSVYLRYGSTLISKQINRIDRWNLIFNPPMPERSITEFYLVKKTVTVWGGLASSVLPNSSKYCMMIVWWATLFIKSCFCKAKRSAGFNIEWYSCSSYSNNTDGT